MEQEENWTDGAMGPGKRNREKAGDRAEPTWAGGAYIRIISIFIQKEPGKPPRRGKEGRRTVTRSCGGWRWSEKRAG